MAPLFKYHLGIYDKWRRSLAALATYLKYQGGFLFPDWGPHTVGEGSRVSRTLIFPAPYPSPDFALEDARQGVRHGQAYNPPTPRGWENDLPSQAISSTWPLPFQGAKLM